MKPEWRSILRLRSKRDKIAIAIDCDVLPEDDLPVVAELVREGIVVWIDRAFLPQIGVLNRETGEVRRGVNTDIYRLTPKGIALCNEEGIEQS